jgi:hypothetical protein
VQVTCSCGTWVAVAPSLYQYRAASLLAVDS